jgi:phosphohistidine phosphatase
MKTLLLLRHAKSSWDEPSLPDFDRPLAPRGQRDAPRIGRAFAQRGPEPELIVSSTALRARETVAAFAEAAGIKQNPEFDGEIYGASSSALMSVIRRLPDSSRTAMLVGHNPGFEDLLARLTASRLPVPTCSLARIDFNSESWSGIEDGEGELVWQLNPKSLK